MNISNLVATKNSAAMAAHLQANGWDGDVYHADVVIRKTKWAAMLYRNAATGEFEVVAKVRA